MLSSLRQKFSCLNQFHRSKFEPVFEVASYKSGEMSEFIRV